MQLQVELAYHCTLNADRAPPAYMLPFRRVGCEELRAGILLKGVHYGDTICMHVAVMMVVFLTEEEKSFKSAPQSENVGRRCAYRV